MRDSINDLDKDSSVTIPCVHAVNNGIIKVLTKTTLVLLGILFVHVVV